VSWTYIQKLNKHPPDCQRKCPYLPWELNLLFSEIFLDAPGGLPEALHGVVEEFLIFQQNFPRMSSALPPSVRFEF
jgi:hypothetical protein